MWWMGLIYLLFYIAVRCATRDVRESYLYLVLHGMKNKMLSSRITISSWLRVLCSAWMRLKTVLSDIPCPRQWHHYLLCVLTCSCLVLSVRVEPATTSGTIKKSCKNHVSLRSNNILPLYLQFQIHSALWEMESARYDIMKSQSSVNKSARGDFTSSRILISQFIKSGSGKQAHFCRKQLCVVRPHVAAQLITEQIV